MAADNTIMIAVETTGVKETQAALNSIHTSTAEVAGKYSNMFKAVSRDIDALTGSFSAQSSKWISDVLGVVEALGTGGALGAVTGVTAGLGILKLAVETTYGAWLKEEQALEERRKVFDEAHLQRQSLILGVKDKQFALLEQSSLAEAEAANNAAQASVAALSIQAKAGAAMLEAMRKNGDATSDYYKALQKDQADTVEQLAIASRQRQFAEAALLTEQMKAEAKRRTDIHKEGIKEEARASQEAADKARERERQAAEARKQERDAINADFKRRIAEEERDRDASWSKSNAAFKSFENEIAHINSEGIKLRAEKHGEWVEEYIRMLNVAANEEDKLNKAALKSRAEAFRDGKLDEEKKALEKVKKADNEAAAAKKKHTEEIKNQTQALKEHTASAYSSAASMVFSDTITWAIQPGIEALTGKLDQLGQVNRDNFWELYDFSKMTPELVAAQVQAMLAGIAKEALTKTAFESAEAIKETAMGFGAIAINDYKGAGAHFISAGAHSAAAGAYAAIGGGAAVGAAAIGATRGATAEETQRERDKRNRGESRGTGPMSGSGVSRDGSGAGWTVNVINNAPLIVPQQDSRVAGRAVARAVSSANRSSFTERMMRAG